MSEPKKTVKQERIVTGQGDSIQLGNGVIMPMLNVEGSIEETMFYTYFSKVSMHPGYPFMQNFTHALLNTEK